MIPTETVKLTAAQARPFVERTFPGYHGRKFKLQFRESIVLSDLHWGGGSRSQYALVSADGRSQAMDYSHIAPWDHNDEGKRIELLPHVAIVEHCMFCGKDCGITIYLHPNNQQKWLTA